MKLYTKTGDGGMTSLIGGERVSKADIRVEAYGTVDELAAHLGLLGDLCGQAARQHAQEPAGQSGIEAIMDQIAAIQQDLVKVMAVLAGGRTEVPDTRRLEAWIDALDVRFTGFVVPGGGMASSQAHVCRTVCRRAERRAVEAAADPAAVEYLNRLSDWSFAVSKYLLTFASKFD